MCIAYKIKQNTKKTNINKEKCSIIVFLYINRTNQWKN